MSDKKLRKGLQWLAAVIVLAGLGVGGWYFFIRKDPPKPTYDREGAMAANQRGLGLMEKFDYENGNPSPAVAAFREAVEKDPTWTEARINLAIATHHWKKGTDGEAMDLFLQAAQEDPKNPWVNFWLGYINHRVSDNQQAAHKYFQAVLDVDPNDEHSWLFLGVTHPDGPSSPGAMECFEKALRLNPYLNAARQPLFSAARGEKRNQLYNEIEGLKAAFWEPIVKDVYTEQGKYSEVIGRTKETHPPHPVGPIPAFDEWKQLRVRLASGTRWATAKDLGDGPTGDLMRLARTRFGGTIVVFDYNGDRRPDILLLAAVVRNGQVENLLLQGDGDGLFTDQTAAAGLAGPARDLGCTVGDFDNDDYRDIVLTGLNGARLLRNDRGRFVDGSSKVGLDKVGGVCLGAGWIDLDQDSDLDLVICRIANDAAGAVAALTGAQSAGGRIEAFANTGSAPIVLEPNRQDPLTISFQRLTGPPALLAQGPMIAPIFSDVDDDRDVDLVYLSQGRAPQAVANDRLLRFSPVEEFPGGPAPWNGGLVLDMNRDGKSDFVLLRHDQRPQLHLSKEGRAEGKASRWFDEGATNSPPLRHAMAADLDADGWTDVFGLAADGTPVFLHNTGDNRLVQAEGSLPVAKMKILAVAAADMNNDCHQDLIYWREPDGTSEVDILLVYLGVGDNGNTPLKFEISGRYQEDKRTRSNVDGVGTKIIVQAGKQWTSLEHTTLSAGLGQTRGPISIGLGRRNMADVLRLRWPDGVPQAEMYQGACSGRTIPEINRKPVSCPMLFAWDGEKYRYITDFLGAGSFGEMQPDGSVRPPRPEESVKIEPGILVPKDGKLRIKITEPMDELMYIDRLQLVAIDHPKTTEVHPDERFATAGPGPTQDLLVFPKQVFPVKAVDHRGRDVTATLRERDKKFVDGFALRTWLGYAEDHFVDLDFGERLSHLKPGEKTYLVLGGWTDYAYPESIYAATQAGAPTIAPTLERLGADGKWQSLGEIGFPAGLPRVITKDVTGLLTGPTCRFRIRTNLQIYWDQIYVAPLGGIAQNAVALEPRQATLATRGITQEIRPNGPRGPVEYDEARTETVAVTPWRGMLTRLGDVTELIGKDDDQFVVAAPGDEITVEFDAAKFPPVPAGHVRSYVLRTWGYCKDSSLTTAFGAHVEPLPFRGVKNFPFMDAEEKKRADAAQAEYRRKWQTRPAAGGPR